MITAKQYSDFVNSVADTMEGDWVLVGGALIAILLPGTRVTADIDLCPIGELTNERRIELMRLAQASGLSLEAINPSADFFLRQIPNWKSSLVIFKAGKKGNLYRPSLDLYIQMKCSRLSESDLSDCLAFIEWHKTQNIIYDKAIIENLLKDQKNITSSDKKNAAIDQIIKSL
ncbi:MAG TPA: hypothetical protein VGE46_06350 [Bdellovibrio sp.]